MASNNDSLKKTLIVTVLLCIVCSVVVSTAAVYLRPIQAKNKALDFQRNILSVAGLIDGVQGASDSEVQKLFNTRVQTRAVDLKTGKFTDAVDPKKYDQRKASKDPARSINLTDSEDIAKISRREKISLVYLIKADDGSQILELPIRGYGLWSTLYGFIALDSDYNTVKGLGFYEQGETPGLGGEVDNPKWKALWHGKKVYGQDGKVRLSVIKGKVEPGAKKAKYEVDGLSGATLTSRGVTHLVHFWLGEDGFKLFLTHLKNGEA